MVQYVTYYSGDSVRLTPATYLGYNKQPLFDIVDRARQERGSAIPVSMTPNEPAAAPAMQTGHHPTPVHAYPASHPGPARRP